MNVYDFDGTIYDGDSTVDFYLYCLRKKPSILLCLPKQTYGFLAYKIGRKTKTEFKEYFYSFVQCFTDLDRHVEMFWEQNQKKIKKWYLETQREDDVIISASPSFLLETAMKKLGIHYLICSIVNGKNGKYTGENCYGEEKVRRFYQMFSEQAVIDEFYSDGLSDAPVAKLAKKSYLVKGSELKEWK